MALNPDATPVVIICPASVKYQWKRALWKLARIRAEVMNGYEPYPPRRSVVILNYEILRKAEWPNGKRKGVRPHFPWVEELRKLKPQALFIDEAHHIKNRSALQTRACVALGRKLPHVVGMSGTPIEKAPAEFWPILNLIDNKEFDSFMKYAFRFCKPTRGYHGGLEFKGADNLEELHALISRYMVRHLKSEVAAELPPKVRTLVPVQLTNRKKYQQVESDFLLYLKNLYGPEAACKMMMNGTKHLLEWGALKRLAAEGKVEAAIQWIKDFLETADEKLIVFFVHKRIKDQLMAAFPGSALVDGSVTGLKREKEKERFIHNPKCRLFLGQIKAAGEGVDGLHLAASTVLFLELGRHWGEHIQAEDRALRLGQTAESINVFYMVAHGSVEEKALSKIESSHDILNKVLDGKFEDKQLFHRSTTNEPDIHS